MARLGRRHLLTIALLGALPRTGRDSKADEPKILFADWINTLYIRELARREAAEAGAGAQLSNEELQALLSPEVQAMLDAVKDRTPPPTEPEGPILHILFGWGALPRRKIEIVSITADGDGRAKVGIRINGNFRSLVLTGRFNQTGKAWQIDDIDYGGSPDRTLRGRLERMKSWPKR
ncbi:hypothetical protein SAMN02990966_00910 [Rhodospirillales bacterium URHD0017]|nr:hypothetical protein SAMN02990966_00910 [Rhodospirillales bacterium URHD0017]